MPFFEHAEDSFLREISLRVTQMVFLPNDYIVKKGDVGDSMLYIRRGEVGFYYYRSYSYYYYYNYYH